MQTLSRAKLDRALSFIQDHGRGIDRSVSAHLFSGAPVSAVYAALQKYQNSDGGFGHGLEPDFLLPDSSPMATTIALQTLADLDAPADHSLIVDALAYLTNSYDEKLDAWPSTPSSVNDYPHAPWWSYDPETPVRHFALNPSAEIVGYYLRWRASVPTTVRVTAWLNRAIDCILQSEQIESHEFLCCARLAETPGVEDQRERITQRLIATVHDVIQTNRTQWQSYCIKPLTAAPRPDSLLADALREAIPEQLDFEIEQLGEAGAWEPHWSWFGSYPSDWERVRPGICAHVTLETLRALHAWGRVVW